MGTPFAPIYVWPGSTAEWFTLATYKREQARRMLEGGAIVRAHTYLRMLLSLQSEDHRAKEAIPLRKAPYYNDMRPAVRTAGDAAVL